MFKILDKSHDDVFGVEAIGKLEDADYKEITPLVEKIIETHGHIKFLIQLEDFKGWTIHAAFDDMRLGLKHHGDIAKFALVGNKHWEEVCSKCASLFVKGEVKYYDVADVDAAWEWIE
mgnify:CR=1 FL=1|tara:strand:+ start:2225 stop:2578 length:354 start_codon:yes stop_codon:yes gene_type:complete